MSYYADASESSLLCACEPSCPGFNRMHACVSFPRSMEIDKEPQNRISDCVLLDFCVVRMCKHAGVAILQRHSREGIRVWAAVVDCLEILSSAFLNMKKVPYLQLCRVKP